MMDAAYPIGFIGLGTMGEAMAVTLVKAGTRLLAWNRTHAKAEILATAGADVAREAAGVFAHCATVFLMLVGGAAIDTVLDRGGAAFAERVSGHTIVHTGTTSPAYSRDLEADIRSVGGYYVEAPVSGSAHSRAFTIRLAPALTYASSVSGFGTGKNSSLPSGSSTIIVSKPQ
jgi:3-hydroxyisobutyrate dehydrogenase